MKINESNGIDWKATLLGETLSLGVLSKVIQSNPEREWMQSLIKEDVFSEFPLEGNNNDIEAGLSLLQTWGRENKNGLTDEMLLDLRADYTRLFIGVGKPFAPPWESVYFNEDRMIFQQQTLQVREWYHSYGLEVEKSHKEPDDHIGLELSFLAHLALLGLQALEEKDETKFETCLQAQRQFLSEHPLKWIQLWSRLVQEHAETDFYRGLAHLSHGALLAAAEHLQIELPKEVSL
ncbi:MAG: TorD/DmsD family molecular chaperone [Anaerolineales bacterium]